MYGATKGAGKMKKFLLAAFAVAAISVSSALAAPVDKVVVCHNTGSVTNPFVMIEISYAGKDSGHTGPGHHQEGDDSSCSGGGFTGE